MSVSTVKLQVVYISQHHRHPEKFLNYIWVSLKVETCCLRLCAKINISCLQHTAGGQECRVHRVWPPAVRGGSDTAKAAADAKWIITAWPYLTWTEGQRNNSLMHPKGRNCVFYVLSRVVKFCWTVSSTMSVNDCGWMCQYLCEWVDNRRIANCLISLYPLIFPHKW